MKKCPFFLALLLLAFLWGDWVVKAAGGKTSSGSKSGQVSAAATPSKVLKEDAALSNWSSMPASSHYDAMPATLKAPGKDDFKQGSTTFPGGPGTSGRAGGDTTGGAKRQAANETKLLTIERAHSDLKAVGETIVNTRRQVTDNPKDPELRLKLGTYLFLAGDYDGAASELKSAIDLRPNDGIARAQLARVLDFVGDHGEALTQFRRAVELMPGSSSIHLLFAESLMRGANVPEAVNEYHRAIAIEPSANALSGLAEALNSAGDASGSLKAARQAVSLEPSSAPAQVALTNALLQSGDQQAALRTARQASLLNPNFPDSHLALGRCLYALGDTTAAVEEFKQAVSLDPLNARARNDLGYALYGGGDILSAINEYRLALRLNPRLTEARNNLEVAIYRLTGAKAK